MTESNTTYKNGLNYMHKDANEMQSFLLKIRSKSRADKSNPNTFKAFTYADALTPHGLDTATYDTANMDLYDILINNIGNQQLINTLGSSHIDSGVSALQYIKSCFAAGGNPEKEAAAALQYSHLLTTAHIGMSVEELSDLFNQLMHQRRQLQDGARVVHAAKYCLDIADMIKGLSHEHKIEVRSTVKELEYGDREDPGKVHTLNK